jgi:uncharacterized repeat protein (TIGR01451 family)
VTRQGAVIGGQDTGYDWDHPALKSKYRGWDGANAQHDYNWHDAIHQNDPHTASGNPCGFDSPLPCDDFSHGTHTMGTMVGDDGGSNQVGMAPGAKWVACRNMEQGWGMPSTYAECYQWFIAPWPYGGDPFQDGDPGQAPDVINNSWSCPANEGCTQPDILLNIVDKVRAAGIVTAHAAGNSGPGCGSISTPAAIYDSSFTVGNTTSSDAIATNSSRGAVTVDGSGRLKPDISAPGTSIRSSVPGGGYSYMSGTSMAGPHVAGLVALLISARPSLAGDVDGIEHQITRNAVPLTTNQICNSVPGSEIPNNTFGWGRIDAWKTIQNLPYELVLRKTPSAYLLEVGQVLTYTLSVTNTHPTSTTYEILLSDVIPLNTIFITATLPHTLTGSLLEWEIPSLGPASGTTRSLIVQLSPSFTEGVIINQAYQVQSAQVTPVIGMPVERRFAIVWLYLPMFWNSPP